MKLLSLSTIFCTLFLLSACDVAPDTSVLENNAKAATPADAQLATIYQRSCYACHTVAATKAPLTGDMNAWQPRLDKGMDTLLNSVINGFGGMPPFGMCMDCEVEDFEKLIEFMAKDQNKK